MGMQQTAGEAETKILSEIPAELAVSTSTENRSIVLNWN
jgi:hypothetical protein